MTNSWHNKIIRHYASHMYIYKKQIVKIIFGEKNHPFFEKSWPTNNNKVLSWGCKRDIYYRSTLWEKPLSLLSDCRLLARISNVINSEPIYFRSHVAPFEHICIMSQVFQNRAKNYLQRKALGNSHQKGKESFCEISFILGIVHGMWTSASCMVKISGL